MRLRGDWIGEAGLQAVLALLARAGHRAFLVGGCVRNDLLGQPVSDIDIATDAVPERVTELARAEGLQVVPTGIEHGTVTVIAGGEPHEVTTFRRDVETFGRHAVVAYSTEVAEDAARRDFTINALYATAAGEVIDPLGGGLADLAARRVRFVGAAEQRIREDYLRILRFFRFLAWYGDPAAGPDPEGLSACAELSAGIETLSPERITAELRKLLAAPDPAPAVAAMERAGVLARVLPGAEAGPLAALVGLEAGQAPAWTRRLAALSGVAPAARLRLSRDEARRWRTLREAMAGPAGPAELGYRHGAEAARDIVLARAAVTGHPPGAGWEEAVAAAAAAVCPVRAADLMPQLSGAALGARLREIEAEWIGSGFRLTREQLLA